MYLSQDFKGGEWGKLINEIWTNIQLIRVAFNGMVQEGIKIL